MNVLGASLREEEVAAAISFAVGWAVVGLKSLGDRIVARRRNAEPPEEPPRVLTASTRTSTLPVKPRENVTTVNERSRVLRQLCRFADAAEADAVNGQTDRCDVFVASLKRNLLWLPSDVAAEATGLVDAWNDFTKSGAPTAAQINEFLKRSRDLRGELESEFRASIGLA